MTSKKNSKSFEFGDTSIKFERPIENINNEQQTSFEQHNSNGTRNKSKKHDKTNRTQVTRVDRYAE